MTSLSARLGKCLLVTSLVTAPLFAGAEVIFEENFDDQPDWHSGLPANATAASPAGLPDRVQSAATHLIPKGWYSVRQDPMWAPSVGHPDRHEAIEILASNRHKARGGEGKSFVSWRDSYNPGWNRWNSESMLVKHFPEGYRELYVEFWIRFSEDWTRDHVEGVPQAVSKIFRISSWSGEGSEYQAFGGGELGPIFLWDYAVSGYGVRNMMALRGGPHGENYGLSSSDVVDAPRALVGSGDLSLNFTSDVRGMGYDGGNPLIRDKVSGNYINVEGAQSISHDQIFGPGASWTKMAFYVRLNSEPDKNDGVLIQWMDDVQILKLETIPWVKSSDIVDGRSVKWNLVSLGGNDFFQTYPNSARHEEWYAIDDVVVRTSIPEGLLEKGAAPPAPPSGVKVD